MKIGNQWVIVLAAGEGSRLRSLTLDDAGVATPKQYCSLRGDGTFLDATLRRAERLVPRDHIVVVVAAEHARWWRQDLAHLPPHNVVVQPRNRGTCPGLLLPLLAILQRDPGASVLVLPSDHHIADEPRFARSTAAALAAAAGGDAGVTLLGVAADAPLSDYGWIVPADDRTLAPVAAFVEKPAPVEARRLFVQGAAWNTFLFAARGQTLVELIDHCVPGLAADLRSAALLGGDAVSRLYDRLPSVDLSRDVFQRDPSRLSLLKAPTCGWTDLGTPERVAECLTMLPPLPFGARSRPGRVVLSERLRGGPTAASA